MERMHQTPKKTHQAPSSFLPRSSLVQRKCACGGVAGIDDLCEQCRSQRLSGQRDTRNFLESSWPASLGHDVSGTSHQPLVATQQPSGGSRFGHDFSQIPVHATTSEPIQAKLNISQPGDRYEQEADQVAEQVMRMPDSEAMENAGSSDHTSPLHIQGLSPQSEAVHRQQDKEEEEETLQAKESPGHTPILTPELDTRIHSLQGGGQPLTEATRAFMEPRFGHDFSHVRVHTGPTAEQSAQDVEALAYTVGHDIVFGASRFAPGTQEGQRLLAHELAHVVQQSSGQGRYEVGQGQKLFSEPGDPDEVGAEATANRLTSIHQSQSDQVPLFPRTYLHLQNLKIQRLIYRRPVTDDATSKQAGKQIEEVKQMLNNPDIDPAARPGLEARIGEAESALKAYRETIDSNSSMMNPTALGTTTTGNPLGAIVVLLAAAAAWLFASSASRSTANKQAAETLARSLRRLSEAIGQTILAYKLGEQIRGFTGKIVIHLARILGTSVAGRPPDHQRDPQRDRPHWWKEIKNLIQQIRDKGLTPKQLLRELGKRFTPEQLAEIREALRRAAQMMGEGPPNFPPAVGP